MALLSLRANFTNNELSRTIDDHIEAWEALGLD